MLNARAIALRGVGFSAKVRALNGLWDTFVLTIIPRRFLARRATDNGDVFMPVLAVTAISNDAVTDVAGAPILAKAEAPTNNLTSTAPVADTDVALPAANYEVRS